MTSETEKYKNLSDYALKTLHQALNALEGRYPWPVAKAFTQKEAREVAAKCVRDAIHQISADKTNP